MLLLIDAGNTRVKWAVTPASARDADALGRWSASGSVEHAQVKHLVDVWRSYGIRRVVVSNVAGVAMRDELEQALAATLGLHPVPLEWFASAPQLAGIRNAYRNPLQLGCDRFASVIGAHAMFPDQPLIVATCGTATTVDAVSADGVFLGGMILPGLGLMASALAKNTAQLPQVARDFDVAAPFADNTDAAIVSGCIAAQAGAIERAAAAHANAPSDAHANTHANTPAHTVRCILSGGAAELIAPHLSLPCTQVDKLVLIGLHTVVINTPC